jgi:hypothetical protein
VTAFCFSGLSTRLCPFLGDLTRLGNLSLLNPSPGTGREARICDDDDDDDNNNNNNNAELISLFSGGNHSKAP